jgi:MinD-like ATPase involved in chromosome partitioning or flagellar assembly
LNVLTGVASPQRWNDLRPAALEAVWEALRLGGGAVVVDCGPGLGDDGTGFLDTSVLQRDASTSVTLRAADVVLVVGSADPLGLTRLVSRLQEVRAVAPTADLRVVVTRVRKDVCGRSPERQVRQAMADHLPGVDPVLVPDDRPAFDAALLAGRTLAEVRPDSPALAVLDALAESLCPVCPDSRAERPRSTRRRRLIPSRHGTVGGSAGTPRPRRRLGWRPHQRDRRLDHRLGG